MSSEEKKKDAKREPQLRFRGFTDPWEQRKLGSVVSERNHRSSEGELLSVSITRGVFPTSKLDRKNNASTDRSHYKQVSKGDIAYNTMRMWQGASGLSHFDGIVSPAYTVLSPKPHIDARFLVDLFRTVRMTRIFQRNSQGLTSDTWNLKYPALSRIAIFLPQEREQAAIADIFQTLDSLIAAAERQKELLELKKRAYLQQMFPKNGEKQPRLRFPGFTGDWQPQQLGTLFSESREQNGSQFGADRLISVAQMKWRPSDRRDAGQSLSEYRVLRKGDITFEGHSSGGFPYGRFVLDDLGDGIASSRFRTFRPKHPLNQTFWKYLIHNDYTIRRILIRSTKKGTLMNELVPADFEKQVIRFPSGEEQKQISTFLEELDSLIDIAKDKVNALKELKQGYMQKMFI